MAAEKLTKKRLIQILIMLVILLIPPQETSQKVTAL